jgi:hypothetical protein
MKLIAMMMARNEECFIGLTARAALEWVDQLVVLDHASTDRTWLLLREIQIENPGRVELMHVADPVWREKTNRWRMLDKAQEMAATHLAVVDADEVLSGNLLPTIRKQIEDLTAFVETLCLPMIGLVGSTNSFSTTRIPNWCEVAVRNNDRLGYWGSNRSTLFKREYTPEEFVQAHPQADFFYRMPTNKFQSKKQIGQHCDGGMMHLQFVDERRLKAKQAYYKMQEVIRWPGRVPVDAINKFYDPAVFGEPGEELFSVPAGWWAPYQKWMDFLTKVVPWQEQQCRDWVAEHGAGRFDGLDLYGVI